MTARVGVIGRPIAHSISPRFQQPAFDALGLDARYEAWDVAPDQLQMFVDGLRDPDALGANVTIPYKEAVVRHVDGLHQTARFVGAVNTIINNEGLLQGYNTDVTGFQRSLAEAGCDPAGAHIVLWGAGGAGPRRRLGPHLARRRGAHDRQPHRRPRRTPAPRSLLRLRRRPLARDRRRRR